MKTRFSSLDVFRGGTVALMILVNNPGSWAFLYTPLDHASWHGCTPTDLVFPFFLFAVGNSLAFGMPGLKTGSSAAFFKKITKRACLIFLIGLLLNWAPFIRWEDDALVWKSMGTIRILGVLQRIALAYFFASILIYLLDQKKLFWVLGLLLIGYWLLSWSLGAAGSPFTLEGFWGTAIDRQLLGPAHIYKGEGVPFDPEGLASTLGAIPQVIIGYLVGSYILRKGTDFALTTRLFAWGTILSFAGFCWDLFFPINKKIWTSSYVLYSSGIALLILALLIYLIEINSTRGWITRFFEVFGKNPLFIFLLSGFLPRFLVLIRIPKGASYTSPYGWFYDHVIKGLFSSQYNASLGYAIGMVVFYWGIGYVLDKRKIYIRV